jgi:copper chaperone
MKTLQFKSNIKCAGCISAVQNDLNNLEGVSRWEVDITHPDKMLKVESETGDAQAVVDTLAALGYKAEPVEA